MAVLIGAHDMFISANQCRSAARVVSPVVSQSASVTWRHRLLLSVLCGVQLGCQSDTTTPVSPDNVARAWYLRLNYHAVNLALTPSSNTVQLRTTFTTVTGAPSAVSAPVVFSVRDTTVAVDSTGRVTARVATLGSPATIIASATVQGVTLTDSVVVQVDPVPQPLAVFALRPPLGDSAKGAVDAGGILTVVASDAHGNPVSVVVEYSSSDSGIAILHGNGFVDTSSVNTTGTAIGHVTFYATTLAYGVVWRDSLLYRIGYPIYQTLVAVSRTPVMSVTPVLSFYPPAMTIGIGGVIKFYDSLQQAIDVVFDHPENVDSVPGLALMYPGDSGAGNIPMFATRGNSGQADNDVGQRSRRFPVAGVYHYHSQLYGTTGTITVRADP